MFCILFVEKSHQSTFCTQVLNECLIENLSTIKFEYTIEQLIDWLQTQTSIFTRRNNLIIYCLRHRHIA